MAVRLPRAPTSPTTNEHILWEGSPSLRVFIPQSCLLGVTLVCIISSLHSWNLKGLLAGIVLLLVTLILIKLTAASIGVSVGQMFTVRYQITNQRVIITQGLWQREVSEIDLVYFRSTSVSQSGWTHLLGVGHVSLHREIDSKSGVRLLAIKQPLRVKELSRIAIIDRRAELGIGYLDVA